MPLEYSRLKLFHSMSDPHLADVVNRWGGWVPEIYAATPEGLRLVEAPPHVTEMVRNYSSPKNCYKFLMDVLGMFRIQTIMINGDPEPLCRELFTFEAAGRQRFLLRGDYRDYLCFIPVVRFALEIAIRQSRRPPVKAPTKMFDKLDDCRVELAAILGQYPAVRAQILSKSPKFFPDQVTPDAASTFLNHLHMLQDPERRVRFLANFFRLGGQHNFFTAPVDRLHHFYLGGLIVHVKQIIDIFFHLPDFAGDFDDVIYAAYLHNFDRAMLWAMQSDGTWSEYPGYEGFFSVKRGILPGARIVGMFKDIMNDELAEAILSTNGLCPSIRQLSVLFFCADLISSRMYGSDGNSQIPAPGQSA